MASFIRKWDIHSNLQCICLWGSYTSPAQHVEPRPCLVVPLSPEWTPGIFSCWCLKISLVFMLRVFDRGKCSQGWGNVGHERARSWSDSFWDFLTCIHTFDTTLSQESNSNSQLSILIVTRVAGLPTKGLLPSSSPGYLWGRFPLHEMTQMDQMKSRLKGWGMPLAPAHPQWLPVFEKVGEWPPIVMNQRSSTKYLVFLLS